MLILSSEVTELSRHLELFAIHMLSWYGTIRRCSYLPSVIDPIVRLCICLIKVHYTRFMISILVLYAV
jgi:hypothetical protein